MIKTVLKLIAGITLIIAVIVFGPLIGIWSLLNLRDMLMGVTEPYTWQNWASFFFLLGSLTGLRFNSRKK